MSNAPRKKAAPPQPVEEVEDDFIEQDEEFAPIPTVPGDTYKVELTMPIQQNGQTYWVKVGPEVAALPGESADDVADRVQEIALGLLFNTADRYEAILEDRRRQKLQARNTERN